MTQIMGILNLAPDSFSGDGLARPEGALARIDAMIEQGAHAVDVGAESTRPGAVPVTAQEEWRRLAALARALGSRVSRMRFSVDTRHADTAARAIACGFKTINDVSGCADPEMLAVLSQNPEIELVVMHSLTIPADPNVVLPAGTDVAETLRGWGEATLARLEEAGIARHRVWLDPGIGFGKTAQQSWALIRNASRLRPDGARLLIGHSRKSFLSLFTVRPARERDPETLAVSWHLCECGVDALRVHDIAGHAALLRIRAAL